MTTGVFPSSTSPFRQKLGAEQPQGWGGYEGMGVRTFAEKPPQPPTMATATQAPPEVYGAQSDQHPGEDRGFLPQHDGSRVIETSAGRGEALPV